MADQNKNIREIHFPNDERTYLGQNGYGKCFGMEMFHLGYIDAMMFTPINSKCKPATKCNIQVPMPNVPEIIENLNKLVNGDIEHNTPCKINFPENGRSFFGKNGRGKCCGIELYNMQLCETKEYNNTLVITPINSRCQLARGNISIPMDSVPGMIKELQTFINEIKED